MTLSYYPNPIISSNVLIARGRISTAHNVSLLRNERRYSAPLQWRHNKPDGISNHQPNECFLNLLFSCGSKKISTLRVTGLCEGNSPVNGEFPTQRASNAENVSIWWRHHVFSLSQNKFSAWMEVNTFLIKSYGNRSIIYKPYVMKHMKRNGILLFWDIRD